MIAVVIDEQTYKAFRDSEGYIPAFGADHAAFAGHGIPAKGKGIFRNQRHAGIPSAVDNELHNAVRRDRVARHD